MERFQIAFRHIGDEEGHAFPPSLRRFGEGAFQFLAVLARLFQGLFHVVGPPGGLVPIRDHLRQDQRADQEKAQDARSRR